MNFDNLKNLSRTELVELAYKQGLTVHHKSKPETIIKAIIEAVTKPIVTEHVDTRLKASIKAKVPEFQSIYNEEEQTVHFKCKGSEECHNLSVPLHWLVKRATLVMRGRLAPMGLNPHFDAMNSASGKNAYTNTVLAG